jgi:neutral amino acid transport system permease protein
MFIVLLSFLAWLPVAESENMRFIKTLQVSNVLVTLSIFALMAFSLNLHTGVTGMVNFGVIFFVGVGSIVVGILSAPPDLHGYGWSVFWATFVAVMIGAAFGWLLAYPTARLRMDYFAIVTISLGEIVRVLLAGEPLLRAGSWGSSIGISRYTLPGETWWFCAGAAPMKAPLAGPDGILGTADDVITAMSARDCADVVGIGSAAERIGDWMNLGQPAPYLMLLAIIGVVSLLAIWWLLEIILASPWGRILRAIREDEEVAQHHGHDILTHKAASLALGAAIAAFAGALWAWKLTGFQPNHMMPARSTFLVWAAFIVGGAANNKGMVIGAFIIVLMEFVFNVLVAGQGSSEIGRAHV